MSLLFDEICQQPSVLSTVKEKNGAVIKTIAEKFKALGLDSIYFAARGTSDHACIYAKYLFAIECGIPCTLGTPSVVSQYGKEIKFGSSMVVGVSQSGKAEDVLSVIRSANSQGKLTVALTNDPGSPLAKEASVHLYCNAGEEISIAATKTFTSQMYALALLCAEISGSEELSEGLEQVPAALAKLLRYAPSAIEAKVQRYRYLKNAFILARGITYPIALEGALKILETNNIKMTGAAISDFYHGPIAQVAKDDLVIVLASEGPAIKDAINMIERLHSIEAEVFLITDSEELARSEPLSILTPKIGESDLFAPYMFAVCVQLFAYELTVVKGIDPNKSKALKKITITK